jgi:hypothetical protein
MRLEGHDGGFQPKAVGGRGHVRQQGLVPAVDTVEVADRECARGARPVVGKSAKYLHWMIRARRRKTRLYGNWHVAQGNEKERRLQGRGALFGASISGQLRLPAC